MKIVLLLLVVILVTFISFDFSSHVCIESIFYLMMRIKVNDDGDVDVYRSNKDDQQKKEKKTECYDVI